MVNEAEMRARLMSLTDQQRRVAILVGRGLTYAEIAAQLSLSPHTVHVHMRNIYQRLGCSRREHLVRALVESGLLK